jgi:hypothetical protein
MRDSGYETQHRVARISDHESSWLIGFVFKISEFLFEEAVSKKQLINQKRINLGLLILRSFGDTSGGARDFRVAKNKLTTEKEGI